MAAVYVDNLLSVAHCFVTIGEQVRFAINAVFGQSPSTQIVHNDMAFLTIICIFLVKDKQKIRQCGQTNDNVSILNHRYESRMEARREELTSDRLSTVDCVKLRFVEYTVNERSTLLSIEQ